MNTPTQDVKKFIHEIPTWQAVWRWQRKLRNRYFVSDVNHKEIINLVEEDGIMTPRYGFMVTMSCAIAILGLLLSSPAVVIGAMLISPLMGPIMCLGFSFCVLDMVQLKKSLKAIVIGFLLSLAISALIVAVSPITDPTPEIIARTSPNLFDLLVAIFSGLAGGYATIKQKGATIVGVAIATALMPPLAVVGYGLATFQWIIAYKAFFLFMTNLLAISLTVTALAKWYGFGTHNSSSNTWWQSLLIFIVFILLSVPLGLSLSKIAFQSSVTKTVKTEIQNTFQDQSNRISNFSIAFKGKDEVVIDTIVITSQYMSDAQKDIQSLLSKELGQTVFLTLDQIVVSKYKQDALANTINKDFDTALKSPTQNDLVTTQNDVIKRVQAGLYFEVETVKADPASKIITIYPKQNRGVNLAALRLAESQIGTTFPLWAVQIIPPVQSLPVLYFDIGETDLTQNTQDRLSDIMWALKRWNITEVDVVGFASTVGGNTINRRLATQRAQSVSDTLSSNDINADISTQYQGALQRRAERDNGINSFHRVEVRLPNFEQ